MLQEIWHVLYHQPADFIQTACSESMCSKNELFCLHFGQKTICFGGCKIAGTHMEFQQISIP